MCGGCWLSTPMEPAAASRPTTSAPSTTKARACLAGRHPSLLLTFLRSAETKEMMAQGQLEQLVGLFQQLKREATQDRRKANMSKGRLASADMESTKEQHPPSSSRREDKKPVVERNDELDEIAAMHVGRGKYGQLKRLISRKSKSSEGDPSSTIKFYQNMRKGVQSLFEPPEEG